jgi:hypothetical protein
MNPIFTLRFSGLVPIDADALFTPWWRLPLKATSPAQPDEAPQFAHPESGLAHDLELASMLNLLTSTYGQWGH